MTKQFLVNTSRKEHVAAAARAFGAQCHARPFGAGELARLKTPALLIFDAARAEDLTPDRLQSLRRAHRSGVRYAPALVLCDTKAEIAAWRAAGAVAIARKSGRGAVKAAIQHAIEDMRAWVTSTSYVGPCRRRHKAILQWRSRRAADAAPPAARERAPDGPLRRLVSLDALHRRMAVSSTLLSGATIESRRAFRDLIAETQAAVIGHNRHDLTPLTQRLRAEAEAFLQNANKDGRAVEALVAEFGRAMRR
ncbi:MAG: hypothetical protein AB7L65_01925 [Hyphomonadaceae bacterium]